MKKIMGMRRAKYAPVLYGIFSGTYPKTVESDQKSSLVAPPCLIMSLRTNIPQDKDLLPHLFLETLASNSEINSATLAAYC